jgi:hypothetical protein
LRPDVFTAQASRFGTRIAMAKKGRPRFGGGGSANQNFHVAPLKMK